MSDDMGMAEEAMHDAIVESAGYDDEQATAPDDVIRMPITDFEKKFGFRPVDAFEKKWFAVTGKRATDFARDFAKIADIDLSDVVME